MFVSWLIFLFCPLSILIFFKKKNYYIVTLCVCVYIYIGIYMETHPSMHTPILRVAQLINSLLSFIWILNIDFK